MGLGEFFRHLFFVMASCLGLLGVPLPLPLPPLPEDPALLRAAPTDSVLFVEWFGCATPAEAPKNQSERLAAEPELRTLVGKLVAASRGALAEQEKDSRQAPGVLALFDQLVAALQRPGCAFVVSLKPLVGGIVVQAGDGSAALATAFGEALGHLAPPDLARETRQIGGVAFDALPLPGDQFLAWAAIDGHFAVAIGELAAAQVVAGLRHDDAGLGGLAALQQLRAGCKVERPVLRTWAAVDKLGPQVEFASKLWQPLGLSQATAALAESGLEDGHFVSRLQLVLPKPGGLLGALRGRPLSQDDLAPVPDDATVALALRARDGGFVDVLLDVMAAFAGTDVGRDWEQFLAHVKQSSGVHLRDDLIAHADDCVVAWSSPRQGGLGFTAAVAAVPLRDGETFAANLTTMWDKMREIAPSKARERAAGRQLSWRSGYLEEFEHAGSKVWWVDLIDRDAPFGLCWTSTDHHFLFGLMPQAVRCAIDASKLPNFDHALARQPVIARRGDAVAMLYLDLKGLLEQAYAPGLLLLQSGSLEWQREGFDFTLADVPRLQSLVTHLGPEVLLLEATPGGCLLTRRGSLPVLDALLVTCGMACVMQGR
ncbi:MAG TPA: hypothetical protein VFZ65_13675 [Planctomycetota bacterium]|nr:hypothetical protein [Planctomycetota bacterium]